MKRFLGIVMLMLLNLGMALAQTESSVGKFSIIPRIGVSLSNLSDNSVKKLNTNLEESGDLKSKNKAGFMAGFDVEYRVSKDLAVGIGGYYAQQGCRFPDYMTGTIAAFSDHSSSSSSSSSYLGVHDEHINLHYINVPLFVKGYLFDGFAVMAGLQAGFFLDAKGEYETTEVTKNKDGSLTYGDTNKNKYPKYPGEYRKLDWSIPVGVSYEYMNVILDARYHFGLTKANKMYDSMKNKVITVSIGYRFTL